VLDAQQLHNPCSYLGTSLSDMLPELSQKSNQFLIPFHLNKLTKKKNTILISGVQNNYLV
jgi:hypothetical protein